MTDADDPTRLLTRALDQVGEVLDHLGADDLGKPTPCRDWDVADLVAHLMADPVNFLAMVRGDEPDWAAPPPRVEHSWGAEFKARADELAGAWRAAGGDVPLPLGMAVGEFAVHSWDLARATGYPVDRLDPELAEVGLSFLRDNLTPEMRGGAFDPAQPAPEGAGPYEQLAAFAGRTA